MATEGTLFIFEWQYLMWCSIHVAVDDTGRKAKSISDARSSVVPSQAVHVHGNVSSLVESGDQRRRHIHKGYIVDEVYTGTSTSPEVLSMTHFFCALFHAGRFIVLVTMSLHTTILSTVMMQSFELANSLIAFGITVALIYICCTHPRNIKSEKLDEDDHLLNAVVIGHYFSKIYYFMVGLVFVGTESK